VMCIVFSSSSVAFLPIFTLYSNGVV